MLNRYGLDRSYWPGALKLNEALRHVAISFATGAPETMLEADAVRWLPWFAPSPFVAATAAGLFRKWAGREGARARRTGRSLRLPLLRSPDLVLLATLIIPTVAILLLASRTPKFNPRYLMLVSPAYLLILAGGVGALGGERSSGSEEQGAGSMGAEEQRRRSGEAGARSRRGSTQHEIRYTPIRITHHVSRIIRLSLLLSASLSPFPPGPAQLVRGPGVHQGAVARGGRGGAGADGAGRGGAVGLGPCVAGVGLLRGRHPAHPSAGSRHPGCERRAGFRRRRRAGRSPGRQGGRLAGLLAG